MVITDRFPKFTGAITLKPTTPTVLAECSLNHWALPFGPPLYLLTDNGSNLAWTLSESVCATLGLKQYFTTGYHSQINEQVKSFNRTLVERMRHYVAEH